MPFDFSKYQDKQEEAEESEVKKSTPIVKNIKKKPPIKKPKKNVIKIDLDAITLNKSAKLNLLKVLYAVYTDGSTTNKTKAEMERKVNELRGEE